MGKIIMLVLMASLLSLFVIAHEHNFEEVEKLIEDKVPCGELSEDQLEAMGDYYMEQMHPGEAHEVMDEMMGGEGSEALREMHTRMARSFYCGESDAMSPGMMNMMMGRGMMNDGGYGMMGSTPFGWYGGFGLVFMLVFWGLVIWLAVWITMKITKTYQKSESALEILKKRFARGEITKK